MEKNREAGVLASDGKVPSMLSEHLAALIFTNVIRKI